MANFSGIMEAVKNKHQKSASSSKFCGTTILLVGDGGWGWCWMLKAKYLLKDVNHDKSKDKMLTFCQHFFGKMTTTNVLMTIMTALVDVFTFNDDDVQMLDNISVRMANASCDC